MKNIAILVVDMLNDFVTGSLKCDRAKTIIKPLAGLLKWARDNKIPVIFCNDAHTKNDHELKLWGPHAMKGTKGAKVIAELRQCKHDYVIEKHCYSSFFKTNLQQLLEALHIDTVVITGLHTHMCCRHTAADAYQNGYEIIVPKDCISAFTSKDHIAGLDYLKSVYGAKVITSKTLIKK